MIVNCLRQFHAGPSQTPHLGFRELAADLGEGVLISYCHGKLARTAPVVKSDDDADWKAIAETSETLTKYIKLLNGGIESAMRGLAEGLD